MSSRDISLAFPKPLPCPEDLPVEDVLADQLVLAAMAQDAEAVEELSDLLACVRRYHATPAPQLRATSLISRGGSASASRFRTGAWSSASWKSRSASMH